MKEVIDLGPESLATRFRALVVEDSRVSMRAVSNLIALQPGVKVVGTALDGEDGLQLARTLRPDIVFADLEMPGRTGLELAKILRQELPDTRSVIISVHEGDVWQNLALEHGANAFVPKSELAEKLPGLFWELFEVSREIAPPGVTPTAEAPSAGVSAPTLRTSRSKK